MTSNAHYAQTGSVRPSTCLTYYLALILYVLRACRKHQAVMTTLYALKICRLVQYSQLILIWRLRKLWNGWWKSIKIITKIRNFNASSRCLSALIKHFSARKSSCVTYKRLLIKFSKARSLDWKVSTKK